MRARLSFGTRLLIAIWMMLIVALFLPAWYHYHKLAVELLSETQSNAVKQINSIYRMLNGSEAFEDTGKLQDWITQVGQELGARITYMSESGTVLADSQVSVSEITDADTFATRPEILLTRDQDVGLSTRFSKTLKKEQIFAARKISLKGAIPSGVIRLAMPYSNTWDTLARLKNTYLIIFALILVATPFLSFVLIRELGYPIRAMIEATEAIGNRSYKHRLRFNPSQEFYPLAQSLNRMAENIDLRIQAIHEQQQQLEAVFNGMQEGVMVLDARGKILTINRALSRLIPSLSQAMGRRPLEAIMNLELQQACDQLLASEGKEGILPHNLQISLNNEQIHDVNMVGLKDDQDKGMGAVVVFHDISALKRLERVRQDFVANVSHELRTPLTSIKGYAETLLSEAPERPETVVPFIEIILKNTNHMVKMVDDLLQLARLEAPSKPFIPAPVDAWQALSAAWKACASLAEKQSVSLKNDLPENVSVLADSDQLVQVFRNLLENAIKYSPPGGIVSISCREQRDSIRFAVRDRGPGIPGQHQQRIFERFYRVEKHRSGFSGSTGLGLAICRHIVRNHGGSIWVQSPNSDDLEGTTIYFTLIKAPQERYDESTDDNQAS